MVSACGRKDDADDLVRAQPRDERAVTFGVVGKAACLPAGGEAGIEVIFTDVDNSTGSCRVVHLFHVLGLSSGPQRPGIRSGHEEKREAVRL